MRLRGLACTDIANMLGALFAGNIAHPDLLYVMQTCAGILTGNVIGYVPRQFVRLHCGQIATAQPIPPSHQGPFDTCVSCIDQ